MTGPLGASGRGARGGDGGGKSSLVSSRPHKRAQSTATTSKERDSHLTKTCLQNLPAQATVDSLSAPHPPILALTDTLAGSTASADMWKNDLEVYNDVNCSKSFRPTWKKITWAFKHRGMYCCCHDSNSWFESVDPCLINTKIYIIYIIALRILVTFICNSRKPSEPVANEEEITNKYQKLRNRSYTVSEKPLNAFQKLKAENAGNGYLDLASGGDSNLCRYDRYLHAVICSSARHAHTGYHQKQAQTPRPARAHHTQHVRSRSHDLPAQPHQQPKILQIIFL